jgi:hypothetical protein
VHGRLREQLDAHDYNTDHDDHDDPEDALTRGGADTDEVVLAVVRSCAAGDQLLLSDLESPRVVVVGDCNTLVHHQRYDQLDTGWRPTSMAMRHVSCRDVAAFNRHLRLSAHVPRYRHWVVMLLNEMVLQGVFVDLRPDVARSIVEIGFARTDDEAPLALMLACSTAVSSTLIADEVINSTASAFLAAGTTQLLTPARPSLSELSWWGMTACLSDPLSGYFGHFDAIGWKMIERGQLDTPRQALMPGKRTQPPPVSRVDRLAARRQLRRRSSGSPRRRHRSPRQRRTRRHGATRPPAVPGGLAPRTPTMLIAAAGWAGLPCLVAVGAMSVLLVGALVLLGHHLP